MNLKAKLAAAMNRAKQSPMDDGGKKKKTTTKTNSSNGKRPESMKEYEAKYRDQGSATTRKNATAASDTVYRTGAYESYLDPSPKKKQQVSDLMYVTDKKFYPKGKSTEDSQRLIEEDTREDIRRKYQK